jgi:hypothetical protein
VARQDAPEARSPERMLDGTPLELPGKPFAMLAHWSLGDILLEQNEFAVFDATLMSFSE